MALYWGFVVALVALNLGFSEAQSNNTSTFASSTMTTTAVATSTNTPVGGGSASSVSSVAPVSTTTQIVATTTQTVATTTQIVATTTQIVATTTQTVATTTTTVVPTSSTSSPSGFYTYLKVSFKSSGCTEANGALLNSTFKSFLDGPMFDLKNITFNVKRDECQFNFTFTFGPNLKLYNISQVFEDKLKRRDNTVDTLKLTDIVAHVNVPGVMLGGFKDLAEVCRDECCDGETGGEITLTKNCTPSIKCSSYNLKVEVPKCYDVCSSVCSGVPMYKISLFVLLLGVFINWFPK